MLAGEAVLPTVSRSVSRAAEISAGNPSFAGEAAETGSATVNVGGSTGARSAASERLGDISVDAFRDRSQFLGHSSVATVEKCRLGVNEPAADPGNKAVRLRVA